MRWIASTCSWLDLPRDYRVDDGSYWAWTGEPTVMTSDMHRGYVVADGWDEFHHERCYSDSDLSNASLLTFRSTIHDRVAHWVSRQ